MHEARHRCKKLRGLLRLVQPAFGNFSIENAAIRDAAALLSHLRDANVLQHTIRGLADGAGADAERIRAIVQRLTETGASDSMIKLHAFRSALLAVRGRAETWSLVADGPAPLMHGLAMTYRSARRRMMKAAASHGAVCMHEWRKATKNHGFHIDLLKRTAPDVLEVDFKVAEKLAASLGEHHDLAVLNDAMVAAPNRFGDAADRAALSAAIAVRMNAVEAEAFELGRQIFAARPGAILRRFQSYWEGAHDRPA